jgi:voltage-gated potassium channel
MEDHMTLRHRIHIVLHNPTGNSLASRWVNLGLALLIITNVLAVMLETVPTLSDETRSALRAFELFSVCLFAIEYLTRLWVSVEQTEIANPVTGRLRWMLRPMSLLDLAAIVSVFAPIDLRYLRIFRILRLFRVLMVPSLANTYEHLRISIRKRRDLLAVSALLMTMLLVSAACLLYFFEHDAQPKVFSSIPQAMWWAAVTLTTIGYGDIFPITPMGKICAAFIAIVGVGFFALPAAILTGAVIEAHDASTKDTEARVVTCPHCGHTHHVE